MKKIAVLIFALCLLLCGCNWMDGSYVSVTPHLEENAQSSQEMIAVSSYIELRDALIGLVENGVENATIGVELFDQEKVESNMAMAVRHVTSSNPIGAYAVESIRYEQGISYGIPAVAVNITYLHDRAEIRRIQTVDGMDQAVTLITNALERCEAGIVLLVNEYAKTDFTQLIEDYADQHPETIMEVPEVTVNPYPDAGKTRVLEVKFTYQTSRESLRTMQERVRNVFDSARLYVSEDASESEKYSQLCSFLTNRFDYKLETSITPAYSLLCHGVGDSKATAVCFAAMCRQAGLECLVVSGTHAGAPWFWNIICDEGVYYHVDLIQIGQSGSFQKLADSEMEGYVWDYSSYPACGMMDVPGEQPAVTTEPENGWEPTEPSTEATGEPTEQPTLPTETGDPTEPTGAEEAQAGA